MSVEVYFGMSVRTYRHVIFSLCCLTSMPRRIISTVMSIGMPVLPQEPDRARLRLPVCTSSIPTTKATPVAPLEQA